VDFIELLDSLIYGKEELLDCCLIHDLGGTLDSLLIRYHDTSTSIASTGSLLSRLVLFWINNGAIRDLTVKSLKLHHDESVSVLLREVFREFLVTVVA
jgi:hypothetical protein